MPGLRFADFQQRDVGLDRLEPGAAALHVQFAAGAQLRAGLGQALGIAQVVQRGARHRDAFLRAAQLEIVARHFRGHGDLRIGHPGLLGFQVGARRLAGAALASEQIELPAGIEAQAVALGQHARAAGVRIRRLAAAVVAVGGNVRRLVQTLFGEDRARLVHVRQGDAQVEVGDQALVHQLLQHRVVELRPPRRHRRGAREHRCRRALQRHRRLFRRTVVGADAGAGAEQRQRQRADRRTDHHGSTWPTWA